MIRHTELGETPFKRSRHLKRLLDCGQVRFGGNVKLKIYGRLDCKSGQRMNAGNRVFFATAAEAEEKGYRPCGHCMQTEYQLWKRR